MPCNACQNPTLCTDRCQVYAEELAACEASGQMTAEEVAAHVEAGEMPELSMSMFATSADYHAAMAGAGEVVAWMWQHEETGRVGFIDQWQIANGWESANPRLRLIRPLVFAASPSTTQQQEAGNGWKLVPMEPTGQMLVAGWNAYLGDMKGGTERFAITYRAMLAAAPATMRRQDVDDGWRPIESAPKDGLPLLLATEKGAVVIGKRNKHLHIWVEMDGRETPRQITHWMPLPATPCTPESAEKDDAGGGKGPDHA